MKFLTKKNIIFLMLGFALLIGGGQALADACTVPSLSVIVVSPNQIDLSWNDVNATEYFIYAPKSPIIEIHLSGSQLSYSDTGLESDKMYCYYIAAKNAFGWSGWTYLQCDRTFVCIPGVTEEESCGLCGTKYRTCDDNGQWVEWGSCSGGGECAPGATQDCGYCGTQTCQDNCFWGFCTGEGECEAGAWDGYNCSGSVVYRICSDICYWGDWHIMLAPGDCAPWATKSCTGACGTGTEYCRDDCSGWENCDAPGCDYSPSCSPISETQSCGNCGIQTRTRSTSCCGGCTVWNAWSSCSGDKKADGDSCSAASECCSNSCVCGTCGDLCDCTVTCDSDDCPNTIGITSGCDLLLHYDADENGNIEMSEMLMARNNFLYGELITETEANFVSECYNLSPSSNINKKCDDCYSPFIDKDLTINLVSYPNMNLINVNGITVSLTERFGSENTFTSQTSNGTVSFTMSDLETGLYWIKALNVNGYFGARDYIRINSVSNAQSKDLVMEPIPSSTSPKARPYSYSHTYNLLDTNPDPFSWSSENLIVFPSTDKTWKEWFDSTEHQSINTIYYYDNGWRSSYDLYGGAYADKEIPQNAVLFVASDPGTIVIEGEVIDVPIQLNAGDNVVGFLEDIPVSYVEEQLPEANIERMSRCGVYVYDYPHDTLYALEAYSIEVPAAVELQLPVIKKELCYQYEGTLLYAFCKKAVKFIESIYGGEVISTEQGIIEIKLPGEEEITEIEIWRSVVD